MSPSRKSKPDLHDGTRAVLAYASSSMLRLVDEALKDAQTCETIEVLKGLQLAITLHLMGDDDRYKGGKIGSEFDRHRLQRDRGCTCCPHDECICELTCEYRCPVHAPLIIEEQRAELLAVRGHLQALLSFAQEKP